jgi:hypothetical protein
MQEKRSIERIRCYYYLKVYDKASKEDVGSVVDISMKGMRLVGENRFPSDTIYHFLVKLPKGYILGDSFDINATARWCNKSKEQDKTYYEAGFEFVNAERKGVIFLRSLLNDFKSNDLL